MYGTNRFVDELCRVRIVILPLDDCAVDYRIGASAQTGLHGGFKTGEITCEI